MRHDVRNYIGGEWVGSLCGKTTLNINPADIREIIGEVPLQDESAVEKAIESAVSAFPSWKAYPAPKRGAILFSAWEILKSRAEELAFAMTKEEGKTLAESRGEVTKALNLLEFIAGEGRRLGGETLPSELPNTFCYTIREPVGIVAVITPWNFPVAIPIWKIAPALIAGNCIIFKPSTLTPWTAEIIVSAFADAGVPKGVLNFITGSGAIVGDKLIRHRLIRACTFTGSNAVGMHLYRVASETGKKVQCEMGGKNPVVVLEDADLDLAAEAICQGAFGSTGQRCTATSRVVVVEEVADPLIERIVERTRKIVVGNGLREDVSMGPCVDEAQMNTVLYYIRKGCEEGGEILIGGERLVDEEHKNGYFVAPTVIDKVNKNMIIAQEEIFGPVLAILRVNGFEEAIDVANSVKFGLSSSIFTNDINRVFKFIDRIETGIVHVNSPTVGGEAQLPFGGIKETGIGPREQGKTAVEFFTEIKTVYVDYTGIARKSKIY